MTKRNKPKTKSREEYRKKAAFVRVREGQKHKQPSCRRGHTHIRCAYVTHNFGMLAFPTSKGIGVIWYRRTPTTETFKSAVRMAMKRQITPPCMRVTYTRASERRIGKVRSLPYIIVMLTLVIPFCSSAVQGSPTSPSFKGSTGACAAGVSRSLQT